MDIALWAAREAEARLARPGSRWSHARGVAMRAEEVASATRDADVVMVAQNPLTAAHIAAFGPNVRLIARTGSGLDAIDLDAARERGLTVYHVPDYCTAEVATQALALILAVQRRVLEGDRIVRAVDDWRSIGLDFRATNF